MDGVTKSAAAIGQVSRDNGVPLYRQIKSLLMARIESRALEPHERLPSERELVGAFGLSRITVRRALTDLVSEGYLYSAPGTGFFVAERPRPFELDPFLSFTAFARQRGLDPSSRVVGAEVVPAAPSLARQLGLRAGSEVLHLARVRLLDDVPMTFQRLWVERAVCPTLLDGDLERLSVFAELTERCGVVLARAETTVGARLGTEEERRLLELADPGVVLSVDQLTFDGDGRPVELSLSVHHPQRYPISLVQGETPPSPAGFAPRAAPTASSRPRPEEKS